MGALIIETTTGKVADLTVKDADGGKVITGIIGIKLSIGKNTQGEDVIVATIDVVPQSVSLGGVDGAVKIARVTTV